MLLQRFREAGEPIDGVIEFVEIGNEHNNVTRCDLMFQDLPPTETKHRSLPELAEQRLPEEVAIRQPVPLQIGAIGGTRGGAESYDFTFLCSTELHGFHCSQCVLNTCRHVFPETIVLGECGL